LNLKSLEGVSVDRSEHKTLEIHMSVIGESCRLSSENSPGCGCAANGKVGGRAAGTAAAMTALAAVACSACCILPFTLPAVILASAGGAIAMLDHAHGWVTRMAVVAVGCAWLWIGWQVRKTQRRPARSTLAVMLLATFLAVLAASWPTIEPMAFHALGIVKKRTISPNE
jgi:hypothetical protein